MSLFEIGMLIILVTLCLMLIVNRICKCVEIKSMSNAFAASAVSMQQDELRNILEGGKKKFDRKED